MSLTFYFGSGSPFAWKVWLALEHKQIAYEPRRLSFDAGDLRKPEYLALNPRHKVPTIVDDGFALYESAAIVEYLEERFPGSGEPLWPREPQARAIARRLAVESDNYVYPAITKLVREALFRREPPDPAVVAEAKEGIRAEMAMLERALKGPFVAGERPTAADFALYPHCAFLDRIDAKRPGLEAGALAPPSVRAWMKRIEALPFFQKTYPPHWKE
jgi:glutathione S-transferase